MKHGHISIEDAIKHVGLTMTHQRQQMISIVRKTRGLGISDGKIYISNINKCPRWVQYMMCLKENGRNSAKGLSEVFDKDPKHIYNELGRYEEHLVRTYERGVYYFEIKM